MQADMKLSLFLPAAQAHPLQVIDITPGHDAAAVWGAACRRSESRLDLATPLLLLPEGYSLLPGDTVQQARHASHLPCWSSLGFHDITGAQIDQNLWQQRQKYLCIGLLMGLFCLPGSPHCLTCPVPAKGKTTAVCFEAVLRLHALVHSIV